MSMKNPLTPAGIETAIFRFVAQHFKHCATAVPLGLSGEFRISVSLQEFGPQILQPVA